jgi:UDP-glucose 4-epimerase
MRVVVTGASGNVGSAVVEALVADQRVTSVTGICRRPHDWRPPRTSWRWGDVAEMDLDAVVRGADVVVHLAWLFHPMRHAEVTWRSNVIGTRRLLQAVHRADVPALVVASSVGAYSPRADLEPVDETWPTDGQPLTAYSREKAYVERLLDIHEESHPDQRVVRLRPAFTFQARSGIQQRRLFLGPLVPGAVLAPGRIPLLPLPSDLRLQAVHTTDVAAAYLAAALGTAHGAFNIAADPVLDPDALATLLKARWTAVPAKAMRAGLFAAHHAHVVPTAPELFDLLMTVPVMSARRARDELGWQPRHSGADAVASFLRPLDNDEEPETPPLPQRDGLAVRVQEVATGLGHRP